LPKSLSIEDSLQWTQQFAMREWRLVFPVALAFLALPPLALSLLIPANIAAAFATLTAQTVMPLLAAAPWLVPVSILVQLIAFIGALAIVALALVPRISVLEAIVLGVRRFPVFLLSTILVILAELCVAVIVALVLQLARLVPSAQQSLLVLVIFGISIFASIRLITLAPVVIASRAGPLAALRLAWGQSAGVFWRLFFALLIYCIGGGVVAFASTFAVGSLFVLLGRLSGAPDLGMALSTTFLRVIFALFWAGLHILVVALYRQLGGSIRGT